MPRKLLKEYDDLISRNNKEMDNLWSLNHAIWTDRVKQAIVVVKQEGLLNSFKWTIDDAGDQGFSLKGVWIGKLRPEIQVLLNNPNDGTGAWHYSTEIEKDVTVKFDDDRAYLVFQHKDKVAKFIKEWKLKVDTTEIKKFQKDLIRRAEKISDLLKLLK